MTARQFTFTVESASVPAWFGGMVDSTWYSLSTLDGLGASSPTILSNLGGQPTYGGSLNSGGYNTPTPLGVMDFSGGVVIDRADRLEQSLVVYGGGHLTGGDNGVYGLNLWSSTPTWRAIGTRGERIWPVGYESTASIAEMRDYNYGSYIDGTPVDSHTSQLFVYDPAGDRIWHEYQSGMYQGGSGFWPTGGGIVRKPSWWTTPAIENTWSLSVASGAWTQHYQAVQGDGSIWNGIGPTIIVPAGVNPTYPFAHVLRFRGASGTAGYCFIVNTVTGVKSLLTECDRPGLWTGNDARAVRIPGVEIGLVVDENNSRLRLMDLTNYAGATFATSRTVEGWPSTLFGYSINDGFGMVWDEAAGCAYLWGFGAAAGRKTILKLAPTVAPSTRADWFTATWRFTQISPGGVTPTDPHGSYQTYGRFNFIPNFAGSSEGLIVLVNEMGEAPFVLKVPAGGL